MRITVFVGVNMGELDLDLITKLYKTVLCGLLIVSPFCIDCGRKIGVGDIVYPTSDAFMVCSRCGSLRCLMDVYSAIVMPDGRLFWRDDNRLINNCMIPIVFL